MENQINLLKQTFEFHDGSVVDIQREGAYLSMEFELFNREDQKVYNLLVGFSGCSNLYCDGEIMDIWHSAWGEILNDSVKDNFIEFFLSIHYEEKKEEEYVKFSFCYETAMFEIRDRVA